MREENYLIALFNKDVLDLSIPVPTVYLKMKNEGLIPDWLARGGGEGMLTRTLEWNLAFCLIGFLFDESGQVRKKFLGERNKGELSAQFVSFSFSFFAFLVETDLMGMMGLG